MHLQTGQLAAVRGARVGDFPAVSVLVTSTGERPRLEACLASLLPQCEAIGAQLLLVRAADEAELDQLRQSYPNIGIFRVEAGKSVREMRSLGIVEAEGDIILFEEDRPVPENWLVPRIPAGSRVGAGIE